MIIKNGSFSLGLPFTFLEGRYQNYGQDAFNRYAIERGDPVKNGGLYTHGSGYEWETVFQKAFEQDENLQRIDFDSEAGAFFLLCGRSLPARRFRQAFP